MRASPRHRADVGRCSATEHVDQGDDDADRPAQAEYVGDREKRAAVTEAVDDLRGGEKSTDRADSGDEATIDAMEHGRRRMWRASGDSADRHTRRCPTRSGAATMTASARTYPIPMAHHVRGASARFIRLPLPVSATDSVHPHPVQNVSLGYPKPPKCTRGGFPCVAVTQDR